MYIYVILSVEYLYVHTKLRDGLHNIVNEIVVSMTHRAASLAASQDDKTP